MSFAAAVLATSPTSYCRLNETSGSTFADATGNGNTVAAVGSPTPGVTGLTGDGDLAVGLPGGGGGTDHYVARGDQPWHKQAAWTLMVMVRLTSTQSASIGAGLLTKWNTTTASQQTFLLTRHTDSTARLAARNTGGTTYTVTGGPTLSNSTAYILFARWDNVGHTLDLFVDGTKYSTASTGDSYAGGTQSLMLGRYNHSSTANTTGTMPAGTFDEFAYWSTPLSDATIVALSAAAFTAPPGVPTSVSEVHDADSITLTWSSPASGGAVDHYEVRIDAGTPTTATSPHVFTGLTASTVYDVEVRAVNAGGESSWVLLTVETDAPPPPGPVVLDYYGVLSLVAAEKLDEPLAWQTWTIAYGDPPGYGPMLPLTIGWEVEDPNSLSVGFPQQPRPTTARFAIVVEQLADAEGWGTPAAGVGETIRPGDNRNGAKVFIDIYPTDPGPSPDPADRVAHFHGHVSSVRARPVAAGMVLDFIAVDDTADGPRWEVPEGPWPNPADIESLADRLTFADTYLDVDLTELLPTIDGRPASSPTWFYPLTEGQSPDLVDYTTVLRFLDQAVIEWGVPVDWSFTGDGALLGKPILAPQEDAPGVRVVSLPQYPREVRVIDACLCPTDEVAWARVKTADRVEFVWITSAEGGPRDGAFDYPGVPPGVRVEIQATDLAADEDASDFWGVSALAWFVAEPEATAESQTRWAPEPVRILGYRDPDTIKGLLDADAQRIQLNITGTDPRWEPDDTTPTGMVAGATFTIPEGGRYYVDVLLRRRVHEVPPVVWDAMTDTWDDLDPGVTWADL